MAPRRGKPSASLNRDGRPIDVTQDNPKMTDLLNAAPTARVREVKDAGKGARALRGEPLRYQVV